MPIEQFDPNLYYHKSPADERWDQLAQQAEYDNPEAIAELITLHEEEVARDKEQIANEGLTPEEWLTRAFDLDHVEEHYAEEDRQIELHPQVYGRIYDGFVVFEDHIKPDAVDSGVEIVELMTADRLPITLRRRALDPIYYPPEYPYSLTVTYDFPLRDSNVYVKFVPYSIGTFFDPTYYRKPRELWACVDLVNRENGTLSTERLTSSFSEALIEELDPLKLRARE